MLIGSGFAKKYLMSIGLLICLVVLSVFWGFYFRSTELIKQQQHYQGLAFFQEVVLTRQWIAQHNGVYVKMTPGVVVNPYLLKVPGLRVVITDEHGERYTLKNPALVTREISTLAEQNGLFQFHITSLKPINPGNSPDEFEQDSLRKFENGAKEHSILEQRGEEVFFRYMAPLITDKSCLICHAHQGYREGDIRGGISVTSSATEMTGKIRESRQLLIGFAFLIILLILAIIYVLACSFLKALRENETKLVAMGNHDFLTNLLNRREIYHRLEEELQRARRGKTQLSLLLLDIDNFKQVNDIHGHSVGDTVLQALAAIMQQGVRSYDLCSRYGGEEFLVVLLNTGASEAAEVAERMRQSVEQMQIPLASGDVVRVTVSVGVVELKACEGIDELISRSDVAMYLAKRQGRNRVIVEYGTGAVETP